MSRALQSAEAAKAANATTDWRSLGVASAGAFVAALSTSVVAISVPVIARDLDVSQGQAS
jgi:hypothetical protein